MVRTVLSKVSALPSRNVPRSVLSFFDGTQARLPSGWMVTELKKLGTPRPLASVSGPGSVASAKVRVTTKALVFTSTTSPRSIGEM